MFFKNANLPFNRKQPPANIVHYDNEFDVFRGDGTRAILIYRDGTQRVFPTATDAIWFAQAQINAAKRAAENAVPAVAVAPAVVSKLARRISALIWPTQPPAAAPANSAPVAPVPAPDSPEKMPHVETH